MKSLVDALNALALFGKEQLSAQEHGSHKPDEIALDFDDALKYWKPRLWGSLSTAQKESVDAVETQLARMSGIQSSELWTEEAVLDHPKWTELRNLAAKAAAQLESEKKKKPNQPLEPTAPSGRGSS